MNLVNSGKIAMTLQKVTWFHTIRNALQFQNFTFNLMDIELKVVEKPDTASQIRNRLVDMKLQAIIVDCKHSQIASVPKQIKLVTVGGSKLPK